MNSEFRTNLLIWAGSGAAFRERKMVVELAVAELVEASKPPHLLDVFGNISFPNTNLKNHASFARL